MRKIFALLAVTVLSGCGVWSPVVRSDLVDYDDVIADTSNKFLLTNILEAREDAPLHFAAVSYVRGSLTATASLQSAVPFGGGVLRDPGNSMKTADAFLTGSITPNISVQSAPSFEVDPYEAKDFVTGISTPIDPKFIKYWVDRGLDKRIILFMFFSSAEIVDTEYHPCNIPAAREALGRIAQSLHRPQQCATSKSQDTPGVFANGAAIVIRNNPRDAADMISHCTPSDGEHDCHSITEFELYMKLIDSLASQATANAYTQRTLIAHDVSGELKDVGAIDPAKYQVEALAGGKYDLYSVPASPSYAFCIDGKFDALSGWRVSPSDTDMPLLSAGKRAVKVKNKHGKVGKNTRVLHYQKFASSGPRKDICSDSVINVSPLQPPPKLPGAQAFLTPDIVSRSLHYLKQPCRQQKSDKEEDTGGFVLPSDIAGRPYCKVLLEFLRTRYTAAPDDRFRLILTPRSVAEMIRFLGDLAYYQQNVSQSKGRNSPVTLGYDPTCDHKGSGPTTGDRCLFEDGGALFNLHVGTDAGRIGVRYRDGQQYSVSGQSPRDHSLEAMSIILQLLNLNKSATDIHVTPTVQVVP